MARITKELKSLMLESGTRRLTRPPNNAIEDTSDPSTENAKRSKGAISAFQEAHRHAGTPPVDFSSRALQPLEVEEALERAEGLLEPGAVVEGCGEAVPPLGYHETDGRRDAMVDTLERPTTVSVRASEHRLELVETLGVLQPAVDTAFTAQARNSIEKMLCHELAAAHTAAMSLLGYIPGMQGSASASKPVTRVVDIARLGNTAARLMAVVVAGCQALQKLKTGGTQRVIVQHQQLVLAQDGQTVVVNHVGRGREPGVSRRRRARKNGK